nr:hypothetical protein [Tanacetum cinerariifolium]
MPPKKRTTTTTTTAAPIRNGDDSHNSGTGSRRTERALVSAPTTTSSNANSLILRDPIEFANELMDQKIRALVDRQEKNKRKLDDTSRNNQNQRQPFKKHNVARSYTAGPGEKKVYGGSKPLCPKCNYHHDGQCAPKCTNCKRNGHLARDCRSEPAANNQIAPGENQRVVTFFKSGAQGLFKRDCSKLKNKNYGNQAGNCGTTTRAYDVG